MHFDFAALLVILTLLTGGIWAADRLFFKPRRDKARARDETAPVKEPVLVDYARSLFPVILAVLVIRSFIVEPFRIPSSSMMPTLLIGDFILVNKFSYGLRLPVLHTEFLELGEPARGDVVVFRSPDNPDEDWIKRIVGLPGDRIAYRNKMLYINGRPMDQEVLGKYVGVGSGRNMTGASLRRERLMELEHEILVVPSRRGHGNGEWVVPEGHYFVMGDNRDNSNDSRFWGTVPERYLVGKAFFIWMNWDAASGGIGWSRIGNTVH